MPDRNIQARLDAALDQVRDQIGGVEHVVLSHHPPQLPLVTHLTDPASHQLLLVVGSDVDHNSMTSSAAKQTIRDWVYAGGFLIVFGSYQQAVQWLQPIFHSALDSASDPLLTPDTAHPILHTPNELDYVSFDSGGNIWEFNRDEDASHFSPVIASGVPRLTPKNEAGGSLPAHRQDDETQWARRTSKRTQATAHPEAPGMLLAQYLHHG